MTITRRDLGKLALGAGTFAALPGLARAENIVAHGVSAFGDLKYGPDFKMFDYVVADAPVGGTFSTGVGGTFDSLNAFAFKGNAAALTALTFDTLMTSSDDEMDSAYGLLAKTIEYPEDRSWTAFELREEARFSDGTPVTAEDVAWTFNTLMEEGHPEYRVIYAPVTGVTVEGPLRVRFSFDPAAPKRDLPMLVAGLPVLSKAWWEGRDFAAGTLDQPVGSGPYIYDEVIAGKTISFRRRDDYWGWHLPVNRGRWHFGHIKLEYFRDRAASFEAFKAGTFNFNEEFWSKQWATGYTPENFPAVARGDVVLDTIPDNRPAGTQGYWFNMRREKFQDIRVREAIAMCFDFEWSNKTLFHGLYTRTDSFFEGGPMQAEGMPTPGELKILTSLADILPPHVLDEPAYVPPVTNGSGNNRKQLKQAAKLLDEAGWSLQGKVRRNAAGEALTVEALLVGVGFERITNPYFKNLKRIGIEGTARTVDDSQYKRRMEEYDFDITVDRKGMSLTPGVELRGYFHSSSADPKGQENLAGVKNPAVDKLIDIIERAKDREELTSAVKALDRVLRALHIWIPQWNKGSHTMAFWDIFDRPPVKPEYARGVIDLWWVDPEKAARLANRVGG
ncbi:ABC transporter substrate-binding protein [Rhodobacteraceae bacterium NNCM2]|nr:ABC transporter substrate-binding protein [Coraliihabitans acroporae]